LNTYRLHIFHLDPCGSLLCPKEESNGGFADSTEKSGKMCVGGKAERGEEVRVKCRKI
jgi:hypothetical protein